MPQPSRRDLFRAAPLVAAPFIAARAGGQGPPVVPEQPAGLITRMQQPRNMEGTHTALVPPHDQPNREAITANENFYIRSHFAVPKIDLNTWKLKIEGHVESPVEFSLKALQDTKQQVEKPLTMECAGNGRVFLVPQARGLQWGVGGVGTAVWGGVNLSTLLDQAVPKKGAVDVILVGADSGAINSDPASPGAIQYDRSIPMDKAMRSEVVLALRMNGEPLPASHGFPLRAVIGGWYGMANVKWLSRIIVTNKPYNGFWQSMDYSYYERRDGLPEVVPVTKMQPKAIITSHATGQVMRAGQATTVRGLAWSGEASPKLVEISFDDGKTWDSVAFRGKADDFVWREWTYLWKMPKAGAVNLVVRCTDTAGVQSPETRNIERRSYMINHLVPVELVVK